MSKQSGYQLFHQWKRFHLANPLIYAELLRMAQELQEAGRSRYGINSLFEVMRWERARMQTTDDQFKINDHHAPFYARLLMEDVSSLEDFFRIKGNEVYDMLMTLYQHELLSGAERYMP